MIPERFLSHNKLTKLPMTVPFRPPELLSLDFPLSLPTISIDSLDIQLIKFALADNTARCLLLNRFLNITNAVFHLTIHPQHIDIYTDGSLNFSKLTSDDATIMGSGWHVPDLDVQYGCASTG